MGRGGGVGYAWHAAGRWDRPAEGPVPVEMGAGVGVVGVVGSGGLVEEGRAYDTTNSESHENGTMHVFRLPPIGKSHR